MSAGSFAWRIVAGVGVPAALLAHGMFERNSPVFGRVLRRIGRADAVALTFDDGPDPRATPRILDALAAARVRATFFVLGKQVERFPDLVARASAEGHEIANHGMLHRKLAWRSPAYTRHDIETGAGLIATVTGRSPRWFRAPHGFRNPWVVSTARALGQRAVGWSLGVRDSDDPGAARIVTRVLDGVRGGDIVLLHDADGNDARHDRRQTADALPGILRGLEARGLACTFLDA